jgi:hypothetical protein
MTSIFALLMAAWLWGIIALGAHATAAQGSASDGGGGGPYERAVVSCPAPREPEAEGGLRSEATCAVRSRACTWAPRGSRGEVPGTPLPRAPVNSVQRVLLRAFPIHGL